MAEVLLRPRRGRKPKKVVSDLQAAEHREQEAQAMKAIAQAELPPPQDGPQRMFLECEADIAIYGGAAYSGKSAGLLLDFGWQAKNPIFRGVIFRRTSPQITNEGGLFDSAGEFYSSVGATPNLSRHEYQFANGATVRFAHLQHEKHKYDWQGAQLDRMALDEVTHFTESQFFYLISRVRSPHGLPTKIRATCNPEAESWVAKLIDWWIGEEGYPDPERSGVIRWFVRLDNELTWGDSWKDLHERFPDRVSPPGEYLDEERSAPLSFTFIPGSIYDNKLGLAADPTYMAKLANLHPVEKERLLRGNWKIKFQEGAVYSRTWFTIVSPDDAPRTGRTVRYWDIAATAKERATDAHFYTAGVKMRRVGDRYTILHAQWEQIGPADIEAWIINTAKADGRGVLVRWELEGGSNAIIFADALRRKLRKLGFNADYAQPKGDKLARAVPLATEAHNGNVELLEGTWNEKYLDELQRFDGTPKPLANDLSDASAGAYETLEQGGTPKPPRQPKQRDLKKSRVFR